MATIPVGEVTLISVIIAADHVDADEQQAAALQLRADRGADFTFAVGKLGLFRGAAGGEVGPEFALPRPAVDRSGNFAIDEDDALVALGHGGKEGLGDKRLLQMAPNNSVSAVRLVPSRPTRNTPSPALP